MKPFSSTELGPLQFKPGQGVVKLPHRAPTGKIGWLKAVSEKPGLKYDIVIRDGLGRTKFRKENCGNEGSKEYGELVNLPTQLGEDLEVEIENVRGEGDLLVHLN